MYRTVFLLFLRCRLWRLPQSGYRPGFTSILPEISFLFYSETPFFFRRSRQARSYGFICRLMYVSSPYLIGTATFGGHLLDIPKPEVHHSVTYTNEKLFQMNFRRSQIIFPCANLWNSFHFFPKVSVADSQIPAFHINSRIFLFLHA